MQHKMSPSKGPEWDLVNILVTEWQMGPGQRGQSRCGARNRLTTKYATDMV